MTVVVASIREAGYFCVMRPNLRELTAALRIVADALDEHTADYCFDGRFRFRLGGEWSLVVSADDAGRFRLDACRRSRVRATLWCASTDHDRLRALAEAARAETATLV